MVAATTLDFYDLPDGFSIEPTVTSNPFFDAVKTSLSAAVASETDAGSQTDPGYTLIEEAKHRQSQILTTWQIVVAVIGAIVGLTCILFLVIFFCRRHRSAKRHRGYQIDYASAGTVAKPPGPGVAGWLRHPRQEFARWRVHRLEEREDKSLAGAVAMKPRNGDGGQYGYTGVMDKGGSDVQNQTYRVFDGTR
jgi:hypothetical protein